MTKKTTFSPFSTKAKADNSAEVYIYGDIGESWFGESVTASQFVRDLAAIDAERITVRINSYGGSVTDGLAIYNALKRHPAQVEVSIDGIAASIASLIAMAGQTVTMAENALLMIHAPWSGAVGNATDLREMADLLDKYAQSMATSYAQKTGRPVEEMTALLTDGEDHWYSAGEALEAEFIDEITDALPIAACYRTDAARRYPSLNATHSRITQGDKLMPEKVCPEQSRRKRSELERAMNTLIKEKKEESETALAASQIDPQVIRNEVLQAEAQRKKDIKARFGGFQGWEGVPALLEDCLDDPSCSPDAAGQKLLAHLAKDAEPIQGRHFCAGQDSQEKFVEAATQALLARMGAATHDRSNPYRGMRLHEIARACLKAAGLNVDGQTPEEYASKALNYGIVRGAQTTSDFPIILENTLHKLILTGFQAIATTWQRIVKIGDVTDFRQWNRIVPGLIGNLDSVNEAGEYLNKVIPDGQKNAIQATRKGNIIQITPEVLVNDDLGYVQDMASGLGAAGARAIERAVYTLLESNPTLSDGKALFHANHGNLASTSAAPTVDNLDSAAVAMASQTAPGDDAEYLDIRPAIALVNTALRGNMRVLVEAVYDPDTANKLQKPNKVNGIVQDIVDTPRIAAAPWYLFASPSIAPVLEVVFLNGQREPRLTVEENFRTSGLAWKVELPFGVAAIDYRGAYKNSGA